MSLATRIAQEINSVRNEVAYTSDLAQPFSGYAEFNELENNFVFKEDANFLASIADKNQYVKFGDKVVDTYGEELVTSMTPVMSAIPDTAVLDEEAKTISYTSTSTADDHVSKVLIVEHGKTYKVSFYSNKKTAYSVRNASIDITQTTVADAGHIEFTFTANTTYARIYFTRDYTTLQSYVFSGISVKEIQTYDGTQHIPEVIVQDQATDGLNVQQSVSKGEMVVVDREELVENGTFDIDVNNWIVSGLTLTHDNGRAKAVSTANQTFYQLMTGLVVGAKYTVSLQGEGSTNAYVSTNTKSSGSILDMVYKNRTNEKEYHTFTATSSTLYIVLYNIGAVTTYWDNISVKQVDETYRAIQDAPSGTLLTDTNYFEVNDARPLTNPVLVAHTMNDLTKSYEGLTGEVLFNDPVAGESTKSIMTKNGYSVVSKGLYSKGAKSYIVMGYYSGLNKGAYHPMLNNVGTRLSTSAGAYWYQSGYELSTLSETFNNQDLTSGGINDIRPTHNPQNKYYDILYQDQFVDLREYSFRPNQIVLDRMVEDKERHGVSSMVSFSEINHRSTTSGTASALLFNKSEYPDWKDILNITRFIYHNGGVGIISSVFDNTSTTFILYFTSPIIRLVGEKVMIAQKTPIQSSATKLSTDLIGSPDNYPQILKDRLAEGKTAFGLYPLLVGQDGTDYTSGTVSPILKNKGTEKLDWIYSTDSIDYTVGNWALGIENTINGLNLSSLKFNMVSYTSSNPAYTQADPLPVLGVQPKVIATNSHSIYKSANIGNSNGYIQVGNGDNGLESRVLENGEMFTAEVLPSGAFTALANNIYEIPNTTAVKYAGMLFKKSGVNGTTDWSILDDNYWETTTDWTFLGTIGTTPQHPTLSLDNSTAVANKYFKTIAEEDGELVSQVFMESMEYDGTWGDNGEFEQLTNGTNIDLNGNTTRTFVGKISLGVNK